MYKKFILPVIALILLVIGAIWYLSSVNIPILEPKGPIGQAELNIMVITVLLCAIVVIPVFFLLFYFAWKYNADNPKTEHLHTPDWDHTSATAEIIWWVVPSIIIAILSVIAWQGAHALDPYIPIQSSNQTINVDVVALDWKWLFIYPDQGIATVNMLEFPENDPVHFNLTADAPMNSFWIPQLGGQIMVMPGMQTQLNLMASSPGTFNGFSANISGEGFAGMTFKVNSVSENDFNNWVQSIKQASSTLTLAAYNQLSLPSENNPPAYYSSVDNSLYNDVIMQYMVPGNEITGTTTANTTEDSTSTSSTPSMPMMPGMNMGNMKM